MKKEISGVVVEIKHKTSKSTWNGYQNTFDVIISSETGTFAQNYFTYTDEKEEEVSDALFQEILIQVYEACFMNSEAYDSFEEWCYDWGYNENDDQDKIIYEESIERGDYLSKIVTQEWIDTLETFIVMADIKTN